MLQWEVYTLLDNSHTAYVSVWDWVKIHQLRLIPSKRMRYPCCLPCELLCFQVRGGCFPSPFQDWPFYFEVDSGHSWRMPYPNRSITCTSLLFVFVCLGGGGCLLCCCCFSVSYIFALGHENNILDINYSVLLGLRSRRYIE